MPGRGPFTRAVLGALLLAIALPASASAQESRTYVSSERGSHTNDCGVQHPCLSFQRAHDNTAAHGEVVVLDPGHYGDVSIDRPITIDGNGTMGNMTTSGFGVVVNLPSGSGKVVLRDIRINAEATAGLGGVSMLRGGTLILDNVRIFGGSVAGIRVQNNVDPSVRLVVDDTKIHGSAGPGITMEPSAGRRARATIKNSSIGDNGGTGIRLLPQGGANARATVRETEVDANRNGITADASAGTAIANVFRSAITDSGVDPDGYGGAIVATGGNAVVRISRNEIQFNKRGLVSLSGGKILSARNNDVHGNGIDGAPTAAFSPL